MENSNNVQNTTYVGNEANTLLPAVFVKTRNEAEEQMKLGNTFKATSCVTPFNRKMLDFYMSKYNYKKSKLKRGVDLYEPVS